MHLSWYDRKVWSVFLFWETFIIKRYKIIIYLCIYWKKLLVSQKETLPICFISHSKKKVIIRYKFWFMSTSFYLLQKVVNQNPYCIWTILIQNDLSNTLIKLFGFLLGHPTYMSISEIKLTLFFIDCTIIIIIIAPIR